MVNSILSSIPSETQKNIDLVAMDLVNPAARYTLPDASLLAGLLELCPEQDVWMYEPDFQDPESSRIQAIFRLQSSRGLTFHMSCIIDESGNTSDWMGPYDIVIPNDHSPILKNAIAA